VTEGSGPMPAMRKAFNFLTGRNRKHRSAWAEYAEALIVAGILALVIRTFFFQAFRIPSSSMEDTLLIGDFLFVNKFLYGAEVPFTGGKRLPGIREPRRGDIIVFAYPRNTEEDYIKRCIAVEGDTVVYRQKQLYVNGEAIEEPYTKSDPQVPASAARNEFGPYVVPDGNLFMMGDNRDHSSDSRVWGPVDERLLRGKAIFIYWSWDRLKHRVRFQRLLRPIH